MSAKKMTAGRRTWILGRIPTLEDRIVERRARISSLEDDIETMRTQRNAIEAILHNGSYLPAASKLRNINCPVFGLGNQGFRGANRGIFDTQVGIMAGALESQQDSHWDNIDTIDAAITTREGTVTTLKENNTNNTTEIANLKTDWREGNEGMNFPHYIA